MNLAEPEKLSVKIAYCGICLSMARFASLWPVRVSGTRTDRRWVGSRFRAGAGGHLGMPPSEASLLRRNCDFGHSTEIDCHHGGDVRDREIITRNEAAVGEFFIEPLKAIFGVQALDRGVLGHLTDAPFEKFVALSECVGDRLEHGDASDCEQRVRV
jgi:hypothetical protein